MLLLLLMVGVPIVLLAAVSPPFGMPTLRTFRGPTFEPTNTDETVFQAWQTFAPETGGGARVVVGGDPYGGARGTQLRLLLDHRRRGPG
jgi:hypothetical protein